MRISILFVSNTTQVDRPFKDPSTRYRCFTPALALARRGYKTVVTSQQEFERDITRFEDFDYFVFHRPMMNEKFGDFLFRMNRSERMIADFDDYIFGVKDAWLTPAHRFRGETITNTARYLSRNAAAMRYFDRFTLSTMPLADAVRTTFAARQVEVFSNALDPGYSGTAQLIRERTRGGRREYKFGYFAGTATHDQDLADIAPALAQALDAHPGSRMLVLGPAKIPYELLRLGARVEHRSAVVPFHRLPAMMAQVETVVAPLERNAFTECKSGLKFFEAAAVGCSVVATPIGDIDRFESSLLRKCETSDQWVEALTQPFSLTPEELEVEAQRIVSLVDADMLAGIWETRFVQ
ncbi:glycosyltransferase [Rhizobium pusense]|uniref:glycosyltransferase n=1 Tax=Agrobacterium pusense TaxID=648995 RepID=UPI00244983C1|nr:glycosyltransferase [Agrobacterium pusense]MDH1271711.1 glycosyltransferase [Agrobacterium pusense]